MDDLRLNRIVLTGATGKMGEAIVRKLSKEGSSIALGYHSAVARGVELVAVAESLGAKGYAIASDLSDSAGAHSFIKEAHEKMGGIDLLIHAASTFESIDFPDVTEDNFNRSISINLGSAFFVAQAAATVMARPGGVMIFISDVAAKNPYRHYLPYSLAKAGVDALVVGLSKILAPDIRVNGIAPYIIDRPDNMNDEAWEKIVRKLPAGRVATHEEVAHLVASISSDESTVTGEVIPIGAINKRSSNV